MSIHVNDAFHQNLVSLFANLACRHKCKALRNKSCEKTFREVKLFNCYGATGGSHFWLSGSRVLSRFLSRWPHIVRANISLLASLIKTFIRNVFLITTATAVAKSKASTFPSARPSRSESFPFPSFVSLWRVLRNHNPSWINLLLQALEQVRSILFFLRAFKYGYN